MLFILISSSCSANFLLAFRESSLNFVAAFSSALVDALPATPKASSLFISLSKTATFLFLTAISASVAAGISLIAFSSSFLALIKSKTAFVFASKDSMFSFCVASAVIN